MPAREKMRVWTNQITRAKLNAGREEDEPIYPATMPVGFDGTEFWIGNRLLERATLSVGRQKRDVLLTTDAVGRNGAPPNTKYVMRNDVLGQYVDSMPIVKTDQGTYVRVGKGAIELRDDFLPGDAFDCLGDTPDAHEPGEIVTLGNAEFCFAHVSRDGRSKPEMALVERVYDWQAGVSYRLLNTDLKRGMKVKMAPEVNGASKSDPFKVEARQRLVERTSTSLEHADATVLACQAMDAGASVGLAVRGAERMVFELDQRRRNGSRAPKPRELALAGTVLGVGAREGIPDRVVREAMLRAVAADDIERGVPAIDDLADEARVEHAALKRQLDGPLASAAQAAIRSLFAPGPRSAADGAKARKAALAQVNRAVEDAENKASRLAEESRDCATALDEIHRQIVKLEDEELAAQREFDELLAQEQAAGSGAGVMPNPDHPVFGEAMARGRAIRGRRASLVIEKDRLAKEAQAKEAQALRAKEQAAVLAGADQRRRCQSIVEEMVAVMLAVRDGGEKADRALAAGHTFIITRERGEPAARYAAETTRMSLMLGASWQEAEIAGYAAAKFHNDQIAGNQAIVEAADETGDAYRELLAIAQLMLAGRSSERLDKANLPAAVGAAETILRAPRRADDAAAKAAADATAARNALTPTSTPAEQANVEGLEAEAQRRQADADECRKAIRAPANSATALLYTCLTMPESELPVGEAQSAFWVDPGSADRPDRQSPPFMSAFELRQLLPPGYEPVTVDYERANRAEFWLNREYAKIRIERSREKTSGQSIDVNRYFVEMPVGGRKEFVEVFLDTNKNLMKGSIKVRPSGVSEADVASQADCDIAYNGLLAGGTWGSLAQRDHDIEQLVSRLKSELDQMASDRDVDFSFSHHQVGYKAEDSKALQDLLSVMNDFVNNYVRQVIRGSISLIQYENALATLRRTVLQDREYDRIRKKGQVRFKLTLWLGLAGTVVNTAIQSGRLGLAS